MFTDMPRIKIELEGIKRSVLHVFNQNDKELADFVTKTMSETLTEDWVRSEIKQAVNRCIKQSINGISEDLRLRCAIRDLISDSISTLIEKKD